MPEDRLPNPPTDRRSRWRRWTLRAAVTVGVLAAAAAFLRWILYAGPYRSPSPLPQEAIVDLHCHTAGIGAGDSGCFVSESLRASWKFGVFLEAFGVTREELEREGDAIVVRRISERIARSRHVDAAVLLALDGVIDDEGRLDRERTELYVPNEFVARETAKYPNLLFGASVNPYRRDALERLEEAARSGACLVKWIPSIQGIDPSDRSIVPFYRKMGELGLPLLSHTGQERSFTRARDELADPRRLRLPLEIGVTVIAAHAATTGRNEGEADIDRLIEMLPEHPRLFADISSLTQINKIPYLRKVLSEPRFEGRLLYGTDFPLTDTLLVSPWYFVLRLPLRTIREIAACENAWDRDVLLKQALGFPSDVFVRSRRILDENPGSATGPRRDGGRGE
jgi:predicted TIM-barrel fold metal-dependent hydrolase